VETEADSIVNALGTFRRELESGFEPGKNASVSGSEKPETDKSGQEETEEITQADLQKEAGRLIRTERAADLKKILGTFGVKKVTEIPEDQFADALKQLQEV
jgi:hypothetical protein